MNSTMLNPVSELIDDKETGEFVVRVKPQQLKPQTPIYSPAQPITVSTDDSIIPTRDCTRDCIVSRFMTSFRTALTIMSDQPQDPSSFVKSHDWDELNRLITKTNLTQIHGLMDLWHSPTTYEWGVLFDIQTLNIGEGDCEDDGALILGIRKLLFCHQKIVNSFDDQSPHRGKLASAYLKTPTRIEPVWGGAQISWLFFGLSRDCDPFTPFASNHHLYAQALTQLYHLIGEGESTSHHRHSVWIYGDEEASLSIRLRQAGHHVISFRDPLKSTSLKRITAMWEQLIADTHSSPTHLHCAALQIKDHHIKPICQLSDPPTCDFNQDLSKTPTYLIVLTTSAVMRMDQTKNPLDAQASFQSTSRVVSQLMELNSSIEYVVVMTDYPFDTPQSQRFDTNMKQLNIQKRQWGGCEISKSCGHYIAVYQKR